LATFVYNFQKIAADKNNSIVENWTNFGHHSLYFIFKGEHPERLRAKLSIFP
jgi:hypothetical protein